MARARAALLLLATCAAVAGCSELKSESVIAPAAVRDAVQSELGASLSRTAAVSSVAALTDVTATYALRTTNERVLVVVFCSREATVQLTGSAKPADGRLVIVRNVVAVYDHDRGTVDRLGELRAALRRLDRAAR
jgi:hypothetical protein